VIQRIFGDLEQHAVRVVEVAEALAAGIADAERHLDGLDQGTMFVHDSAATNCARWPMFVVATMMLEVGTAVVSACAAMMTSQSSSLG
jgi:hypothetical protein